MKPQLQLIFLNIFRSIKSKIILFLIGLLRSWEGVTRWSPWLFSADEKQTEIAMQRHWNETIVEANRQNKERVEIFKFWPET